MDIIQRAIVAHLGTLGIPEAPAGTMVTHMMPVHLRYTDLLASQREHGGFLVGTAHCMTKAVREAASRIKEKWPGFRVVGVSTFVDSDDLSGWTLPRAMCGAIRGTVDGYVPPEEESKNSKGNQS
jgi:hypothetical protein